MQMGKDALTSWVYGFFRQHESLFLLPSSISNHKKIVRQLKVDALAAAAGKQNLPASTATGPDNHEQFIEWYFREQGKTLYARYQSQLKRLLIRQQQAAGIFDVQGFEEHLGAALQALTHLTATSRDQLITARKEERQSLSELNAFKVCHDIQRDAVFPVSREWHYALPVAMGMVEGIANSGFFAVGLETAWLGGLQQALLIAAMNVGVSFHAGVALRGLHSPGVRRLAAGALGVAYGVGLCLFHLAVGHYRTALMQNPESAAITAVNNFIYAPLALGDFHSWLLTLVGVMFGLGAAMSGYKADDPFPGYRPLTRRYKAAVAIYRHLKEQYLLGIEEVIDTQLSAVDTHIEEARKALNTYLELSAEITQLKRNYQFAAIAINDACVAVLQRYRAQNRAVRQHPAPPTLPKRSTAHS